MNSSWEGARTKRKEVYFLGRKGGDMREGSLLPEEGHQDMITEGVFFILQRETRLRGGKKEKDRFSTP